MATLKDKERVFNLTDNIITTAIIVTIVLAKNTYSRIEEPDTFSGDRKKFKVYEA
jgi:hypothetical protein